MALTAFVANLPRPIHIIPENPNERRIVEEGESVFHGIGCAECHVKTHGIAEEIYSDFLLHDMGPRLADESRAVPHHDGPRVISDVTLTRVSGRSSHSSYSGSGEASTQTFRDVSHFLVPALTAPTNTDQEWRTPPLWGWPIQLLTFTTVVQQRFTTRSNLHEGEASASAEEYRRLSDEQRSSLLSFLDTLRAPVTNNVE
ncbi:MAG: di-heme oxidoredictase family protein [Planctomycetaceae bacterium]